MKENHMMHEILKRHVAPEPELVEVCRRLALRDVDDADETGDARNEEEEGEIF